MNAKRGEISCLCSLQVLLLIDGFCGAIIELTPCTSPEIFKAIKFSFTSHKRHFIKKSTTIIFLKIWLMVKKLPFWLKWVCKFHWNLCSLCVSLKWAVMTTEQLNPLGGKLISPANLLRRWWKLEQISALAYHKPDAWLEFYCWRLTIDSWLEAQTIMHWIMFGQVRIGCFIAM